MTVDLSAFDLMDNYHYDIVNASGNVVISGKSKSVIFDIDLQYIKAGMYFIRFKDLNVIEKIIKE